MLLEPHKHLFKDVLSIALINFLQMKPHVEKESEKYFWKIFEKFFLSLALFLTIHGSRLFVYFLCSNFCLQLPSPWRNSNILLHLKKNFYLHGYRNYIKIHRHRLYKDLVICQFFLDSFSK